MSKQLDMEFWMEDPDFSQDEEKLADEMESKINQLYEAGKITKDQKQVLIKAMREEVNQAKDTLRVGTIMSCKDKELSIKLIDEDLKLSGDESLEQINILRGINGLTINKNQDSVLIASKKDWANKAFSSSEKEELVSIQIPTFCPLLIKTVSGDIALSNTSGMVQVKSVSGDIHAEKLSNNTISMITVSGDLKLKNVATCKELISKSGDIRIEGGSISGNVKTYSGNISLKKVSVENTELAVFSGDISISPSEIKGFLDIKAFSGDIKIHIPANLRSELDSISFSSQSGEIQFEDLQGKITPSKNIIHFALGKVKINLKTTSGDAKIVVE
jgi:DUF4097 and DUF4098 domain-containing protein YvlB